MLYYSCMEPGEKSFNVNSGSKSNENVEVENSQETILKEYKMELLNLDIVLDKIRSLRWEKNIKNQYFKDLKVPFLRYLDGSEKNDKLKIYINQIEGLDTLEKIFSVEMRNRFKNLFTEIFRLATFSELEPFKKEFKEIEFPFEEFTKSMDLIKNILKKKCKLELIVPNLYFDRADANPDLYISEVGASHILYTDAVPMKEFEKDKKTGVIKDFKTIGIRSEQLSINEKAIVYLYSK